MLIINDAQRRCADVASLDELCPYCSKPLSAYSLIMSDDTKPSVYHAMQHARCNWPRRSS